MTTQESQESSVSPEQREEYRLRDTDCQRGMVSRKAEKQASFLLPHLRPGMTLLDCGCGPGSITIGLAQLVAPGAVVDIDIGPGEVERATALAAELGVTNVRFQTGDVYKLPFANGMFDAVFSNAQLDHLREPVAALCEMRRVLKPGGMAGVRTADRDGYLFAPSGSAGEKYAEWSERLKNLDGVSVRIGKNLRAMMRQAGFARTEGSASYDYSGTAESVRAGAEALAAAMLKGRLAEQVIELGWAELEATAAALRALGESPDAFFAQSFCECVGWCAA